MLNVGFLVINEPNRVLDKKHQTKLPGIIGWNMIQLAYKVFVDKYGEEKFNSFQCPVGVNPLLFSKLCFYHYTEIPKEHDYGVWSVYHQTDRNNMSPKKSAHLAKKGQPSFIRKDGLLGQVTIGDKQQPICIPGNSTITIPGHTNKLPPKITCLVEQAEHHNLPLGIVMNQCVAMPKARTILVIIINTNRYNVWIRQPLLAAELFDTECDEIEYRANMNWDGNNISVGFQPVPPQLIDTNSCQVEVGPFNLIVPRLKNQNLALDQTPIPQTLTLKMN